MFLSQSKPKKCQSFPTYFWNEYKQKLELTLEKVNSANVHSAILALLECMNVHSDTLALLLGAAKDPLQLASPHRTV